MASKLLRGLRSEVQGKLDLICGDSNPQKEVKTISDDKALLVALINSKIELLNNKK